MAVSFERSSTIPPSVRLWPAELWRPATAGAQRWARVSVAWPTPDWGRVSRGPTVAEPWDAPTTGHYGAVRDEHAAILRRAIRDGGGVEVSTEGDSWVGLGHTAGTGRPSHAAPTSRVQSGVAVSY